MLGWKIAWPSRLVAGVVADGGAPSSSARMMTFLSSFCWFEPSEVSELDEDMKSLLDRA